jgi:hypothetical protein
MAIPRCPGQDMRFWKPKDIFEVRCPYCDKAIEFWKDEPFRYCADCGNRVNNPRIDLGCAKWCKFAQVCLGTLSDELVATVPVVERLAALLEKRLVDQPTRLKRAREVLTLAEMLLTDERGEPCIVKSAALLLGVLIAEDGEVLSAFFPEDTFLNDFYSRKTILEQAGIEPSIADEICALVEAIIADKIQETPEFDMVWDAVQLKRISLIHDSGTFSIDQVAITDTLRTRSGKRMAEPPKRIENL